jgi:predicted dehydrogenase
MQNQMDRRRFLGAAASAGVTLAASGRVLGANEKVVVGVMGMGGRGTSLAGTFQQQSNVDVAYVCDPDSSRAEKAAAAVVKAGGQNVKPVADFRRILEDRDVDVLVVATCNHWHAPAAILGCSAGKHVYVEKPCSHNAREGELMVAAARKYDRRVQMGNQRRSWPKVIEAIELVRNGEIGKVYYAQSWYTNNRGSIGRGKATAPPSELNYDLWQGPAPRKAFRDNYLHYNWHWFWHWGNGELGNNGIHMIDLCRWGLGVDYPVHVTSAGGRFRFQDDQETPDTNMVTFTFADGKSITWEGLSCNRMPGWHGADTMFHGEKGSLAINGGGYTIYDAAGKEVRKSSGPGGDAGHIGNFLAAVRGEAKLNSEIEDGHKSTLLCHLGNIAYRTGRALKCDPKKGHIVGDRDAMAQWSREYEKGWEPRV